MSLIVQLQIASCNTEFYKYTFFEQHIYIVYVSTFTYFLQVAFPLLSCFASLSFLNDIYYRYCIFKIKSRILCNWMEKLILENCSMIMLLTFTKKTKLPHYAYTYYHSKVFEFLLFFDRIIFKKQYFSFWSLQLCIVIYYDAIK